MTLPPRTDVPDRTPQEQSTPESYLGYHYSEANLYEESVTPDAMVAYQAPGSLPQDTFAFGGRWDIGSEGAVAGQAATPVTPLPGPGRLPGARRNGDGRASRWTAPRPAPYGGGGATSLPTGRARVRTVVGR